MLKDTMIIAALLFGIVYSVTVDLAFTELQAEVATERDRADRAEADLRALSVTIVDNPFKE